MALDVQLWNIHDWRGICVTQITDLPRWRLLSILYLAGDGMKEWLPDVIDTLREYAEKKKCKYAELIGRPGWGKLDGTRFIVMRFEINGR